jgi:hypothetical protein
MRATEETKFSHLMMVVKTSFCIKWNMSHWGEKLGAIGDFPKSNEGIYFFIEPYVH